MPSSLEERILARTALQERLKHEIEQLTDECAKLSLTVDEAQTTLDRASDVLHAATSAFQAAQATLNRLEENLRNATAKRDSLTERLASVPVAFDTGSLVTLPTEILQAIFVELLRSHEPSGYLDLGKYNSGRAVAPFTLSAVCGLWRSIAVQTSELWTYVALPTQIKEDFAALAIMIDCLLSRSQARVIDVFFAVDGRDRARNAWTILMPPVLEQFHRWSRASVRLPLWMDKSQYSFLRNPAPALQEIHLHWDMKGLWADDPGWRFDCPEALSACDALHSLHAPATILSPRCFLPGVTSLKIQVESTDRADVVDIVCQMPMLQELAIISLLHELEDNTLVPTTTTRLVHLHTLTLSGISTIACVLLASLDAPQLRSLVLPSGLWPSVIMDRFMPLFRDKFAQIERLEFGTTTLTDSYVYWHIEVALAFSQVAFRNLRHLSLANCHFRQLKVYDTVVWPNLETITLSGRIPYTDDDYSNLVTFLGLAAYSAEELADSNLNRPEGPAQFRLIVRDLIYIPPWLPTALGRLVGPRNCYILDKDGRELATIDSDDDEASFTDSDVSSGFSSSQPDDSSCESDDADEDLLTVNGPAWISDDSDDGDYWPLWRDRPLAGTRRAATSSLF